MKEIYVFRMNNGQILVSKAKLEDKVWQCEQIITIIPEQSTDAQGNMKLQLVPYPYDIYGLFDDNVKTFPLKDDQVQIPCIAGKEIKEMYTQLTSKLIIPQKGIILE